MAVRWRTTFILTENVFILLVLVLVARLSLRIDELVVGVHQATVPPRRFPFPANNRGANMRITHALVTLTIGLAIVGCGPSEAEKTMEKAAADMEKTADETKAAVEDAAADAKAASEKAAEDMKAAAESAADAAKDAAKAGQEVAADAAQGAADVTQDAANAAQDAADAIKPAEAPAAP